MVTSLLKLKHSFASSRLGHESLHPNQWITELENLKTSINQVDLMSKMTKCDFIVHVLNSLPKKYKMTIVALKICFMKAGAYILASSIWLKKLKNHCTCIKENWTQKINEYSILTLI